MSSLATEQELTLAEKWFEESFPAQSVNAEPSRFPVSFRYENRLENWEMQRTPGPVKEGAKTALVSLTDSHTGLQCRCEVTVFAEFPAVEWVVYLKNTGQVDTPIIEDIRPLDIRFSWDDRQPCVVHHVKGSQCHLDDFGPETSFLRRCESFTMASLGGQSSNGALPFFNLEIGDHGVIGAIGWTGGWAAEFARDEATIQVRAGMKKTHLKLHPGEEIRTPRILLLFWEEDRVRAHNMLRRLILTHHTPRPDGKQLRVPISDTSWGERLEKDHIDKVRWLKKNDIPAEYYWIDAGWHGDYEFDPAADTLGWEWAQRVGSWFPNESTYPHGLKGVGDVVRELGMGFVVWVEPEIVFEGTQYAREHPDWLLGPVQHRWVEGNRYLFNLGLPEARRFLTEEISALISESGITCYRQDFGLRPDTIWESADAWDRVGMSEIRHIEGLYAFWDELLSRHPGLVIDNCCAGGRRIDLETISRSVPLWRSDMQCYPDFDPMTMQTQTQGLAPWVPLSAGCCRLPDTYAFRSALGPGMTSGWAWEAQKIGDSFPVKLVRNLMRELHAVRKYFYGDFYPLLSFSLASDAWAAWQYDRSDLGEGMVLAFRRRKSPFPCMEVALSGLDPEARYELRSLDGNDAREMSGPDLMEEGLRIDIGENPGSALFVYRRIQH